MIIATKRPREIILLALALILFLDLVKLMIGQPVMFLRIMTDDYGVSLFGSRGNIDVLRILFRPRYSIHTLSIPVYNIHCITHTHTHTHTM